MPRIWRRCLAKEKQKSSLSSLYHERIINRCHENVISPLSHETVQNTQYPTQNPNGLDPNRAPPAPRIYTALYLRSDSSINHPRQQITHRGPAGCAKKDQQPSQQHFRHAKRARMCQHQQQNRQHAPRRLFAGGLGLVRLRICKQQRSRTCLSLQSCISVTRSSGRVPRQEMRRERVERRAARVQLDGI